jgi:CRP-like cAMP-binding protein
MELLPRFLQYGEEISFSSRASIYSPGTPIGSRPVFYVIAGLVKIEYPVRNSTFALWLHPDSIFGLVETLAASPRLAVARAMERTICYTWDLEGFFTAAGVSWELALASTTGMTRELRILNAEFGERLRAMKRTRA